MRISASELETMQTLFRKHFLEADHLWLFGSRVGDQKRGGDIDLYIETHEIEARKAVQAKLNFIVDLKIALGDQKIDVVLNILGFNKDQPIYKEVKATGKKLL